MLVTFYHPTIIIASLLFDLRWKAISGNRRGSVTFDDGIAYDMLPPFTRNIVRYPLSWLYPNLHHQNVALRTLYLDQLLLSELNNLSTSNDVNSHDDNDHNSVTDTSNINSDDSSSNSKDDTSSSSGSDVESKRRYRIVTLGGGFDTRSIRFALKSKQQKQHNHNHYQQKKQILTQSQSIFNSPIMNWMKRKISRTNTINSYDDNDNYNDNVFEFHEIDLPHVIDQKRIILKRFLQRRKLFHGNTEILPKLYKANLNNITAIEYCLNEIDKSNYHREYSFRSSNDDNNNSCPKINKHETKSYQSNMKKRYYKTIIITEAVLMYLNADNIKPLLQTCIDKLSKNSDNLSLCFTDRFPGIRIPTTSQAIISSTTSTTSSTITSSSTTAASSIKSHDDDDSSTTSTTTSTTTTAADDEKSDIQDYLKSINLKLTKWLTKPGRARHMGVAVYGKGGQ